MTSDVVPVRSILAALGSAPPRGPAAKSSGFALDHADWQLLVALVIGSRLLIALGLGLGYLANTARLESGLEDLFCNWDCDWYVGIADRGYQSLGDAGASGASNWAFFPLMPLAMRIVSQLSGMSTAFAGIVVAQVAWSLGLYGVFLLGRDLKGLAFARHLSLVYGLWPFAIHSAIPMTEAFFVPLGVGAFLFVRRGDWLAAALVAALMSGTRSVGVLLVLPYLMLAISEFGFWRVLLLRPGTERAAVALGATGIGLALYMIHLHGLTGDAMAFSHNQAAWNRRFELPWMMIIDELNPARISAQWVLANAIDIGTGLAGVVLLVTLWRRGWRPEAMFGLVALLIAFNTGNASSLPRYAGGLYPVMLAVALLGDSPLRRQPLYAVLALGLLTLSVCWGLEQFYVM